MTNNAPKADAVNYHDMFIHVARNQLIIPTDLYDFLDKKMGKDRPKTATLGLLYKRFIEDPEFLASYPGLKSKGQKFEKLQAMLEKSFEHEAFDAIKPLYDTPRQYTDQDIEDALELLQIAEDEKSAALVRAAQLEAELAKVTSNFEIIRMKLAAPPTLQQLMPNDLSIIGEWAEHHYPNRLLIAPRALDEVQNAAYNVYRSPERVYAGLVALATDFREARLAGDESVRQRAMQRFQRQLSAHGISESASLTKTAAGKFGRTYYTKAGDTEYFLGRHLKHGNSHDPAATMRVYFDYDKDTHQVVIGSLPRHLDNALT